MNAAFEIMLCLMVLSTAGVALFVRDMLAAITFYIVMGNLLGLTWLALDAVNVALAEFSIGAGVTGILLILTRARLLASNGDLASTPMPPELRAGAALICGVFTAILAAAVVSITPHSGLAPVIEPLLSRLGIENPVTGILLAFRAYDTLLESFVLLGALVAVWSIAPRGAWPRSPAPIRMYDPAAQQVAGSFGRMLLPVAIVVATYLVWVGSDHPGGAFQAGTVLAGGLLLAAMGGAFGLPRVDATALRWAVILGPLVFLAIGLAGVLMGRFLSYPDDAAKGLMVTIEYALMLSIGVTLAMLVAGPSAPSATAEDALDRDDA